MLKFSKSNSKLDKLKKVIKPALKSIGNYAKKPKIVSFSKLSGHCCPFAKLCESRVIDGKIVDGPHTKFRCFSASQEAVYTNTYKSRKVNSDSIAECKSKKQIIDLLLVYLPDFDICRIHVAGDFQRQMEFDAWIAIAKMFPGRIFYAYTKSLPFWIKRINDIPKNFVLTASKGGTKDKLIEKHNLRQAVVYNYAHEVPQGMEIDSDDSHASDPRKKDVSFALLIHGVQPAGTEEAKASMANRGKS